MKLLIGLLVFMVCGLAKADYTHGYVRHNGTYVQGYEHTKSNNNPYDNYGSTGVQAQHEPEYMRQPSINYGSQTQESNPYANSKPSWE